MKSTTRNARIVRATPILVLAFLMAGAGAAPAPTTMPVNPDAAQILAAETCSPIPAGALHASGDSTSASSRSTDLEAAGRISRFGALESCAR